VYPGEASSFETFVHDKSICVPLTTVAVSVGVDSAVIELKTVPGFVNDPPVDAAPDTCRNCTG